MNFNVLIIGGGVVGLTAALAMAQRGHTVAVIDAGSLVVDQAKADVRVYAINHASQSFLQQLGAWQHLNPQQISLYEYMYVWDALNKAHIDFDARYIGAQNLGAIIEESALKQALLQQISSHSSISLFPNRCIHEVHQDDQSITICSGQQCWSGELLMIADGANSPTRQILKVELTTWSYEQNALIATVTVEKSHQQTAYQVFHADGPLAFLPLANPHQCSIVWSITPLKAQKLMSLTDEEFNQIITQSFAEKLGQVKVSSARHQFPLHMRHVKHYVGSRWLLLGDAAHTIHPLAGLGLNVGIADVYCWTKCLDANQNALSSKKLLSAYQRERKNALWQIIVLMELFKRLFSNSLTPIVALRGLGLNLCNKFAPVKRLFIQHACGEKD